MKGTIFLVLFVFSFCGVISKHSKGVKIKKGRLSGFTQSQAGRISFPEQEDVTVNVNGKQAKKLKMKRVNAGKENPTLSERQSEQTAVYVDDNQETFCREDCYEDKDCDTHCLATDDTETCFLSGTSEQAICTEHDPSATPEYLLPEEEDAGRDRRSTNGTRRRRRRSLVPNLTTAGIVKIIFHYDDAFMRTFQEFANGNAAQAMVEATIFTKLVANEMTISYQSLKTFGMTYTLSGSIKNLDLAIYVADIVFPPIVNDQFENVQWSAQSLNGDVIVNGLTNFRNFVRYSYTPAVKYDLQAAMTGYDLEGNTIGIAYVGTVCDTYFKDRGYETSINQLYSMFGRLLAHEIGHNVGASHDGDGTTCAEGVNVMSPYIVSPSSSTKDTAYKFSTCSANFIKDYLSSIPDVYVDPDCLFDSTLTNEDFLNNFCLGFRGNGLDFEELCVAAYGETSSICSSSTATNNGYVSSCLPHSGLKCVDRNGVCVNLSEIPPGTDCSTDGKVCFNGECVTALDICSSTTAIPPNTASTSMTSTTTTTTSTTTTTAPVVACPCTFKRCCRNSTGGTCRVGCTQGRRRCKLASPAVTPAPGCTCLYVTC